jgi:hypothetical protein
MKIALVPENYSQEVILLELTQPIVSGGQLTLAINSRLVPDTNSRYTKTRLRPGSLLIQT